MKETIRAEFLNAPNLLTLSRIVGIPKSSEEPLNSLILNGALSWSGQKPALEPPIQLLGSSKSMSSLIQEDRR